MMRRSVSFALAALLAGFAPVRGDELSRAVVASAGGRAANGSFTITFTAGLTAVGEAGSAAYAEGAGYWPRSGGLPVGVIDSGDPLPGSSALRMAGPNPFRGLTTLAFDVGSAASGGDAVLEVFEPGGRRVRTLFRGAVVPGRHRVTWDGRDDTGRFVADGVYFGRLVTGRERRTVRLVLFK